MIIDCFTFFNELDLLEIRLNELYHVVDKFILVEAELTQSLQKKPLYFDLNKDRYNKFLDKIIHIKIPENECPNNKQNLWSMENFQRNKINDGINQCSLSDEDIILISDLDEIPSAEFVRNIPTILYSNNTKVCSFEMGFFAYFLNLKAQQRSWIGTVACRFDIFKQYNPQFFRSQKDFCPVLSGSGWHFSWLGGYEKIYQKSLSCIEPFDKTQLPNKENFKNYFESFKQSDEKFFIHIENLSIKGCAFIKHDIDHTYPKYLIENIQKYSEYLL